MKLLKQHRKAVEAAKPFIDTGNFYLAGGTAVYYYLNHRESIDLDFFTQNDFDFIQYEHLIHPHSILFRSKDTIHSEVEETKISFFHYPYKLLHPVNQLDIISIAHLEDILCMKINAIINRGSRKDFTDVYFIIQELSLSPKKCIKLFQSKYGAYNPLVIHKAMSYFVDADNEPKLKMLKPVRWEDIKKFMLKTFTNI